MEAWLASGKRTSPMTNEKLAHVVLTPNRTLRTLIQKYREDNIWPTGCCKGRVGCTEDYRIWKERKSVILASVSLFDYLMEYTESLKCSGKYTVLQLWSQGLWCKFVWHFYICNSIVILHQYATWHIWCICCLKFSK